MHEITHCSFRLEDTKVELTCNRPQPFPALLKHTVKALRHNSFPYSEPNGTGSTVILLCGLNPNTKVNIHNLHNAQYRSSEQKLTVQPLDKSSHILKNPLHCFSRHCKKKALKVGSEPLSIFGQVQLENTKAECPSRLQHHCQAPW